MNSNDVVLTNILQGQHESLMRTIDNNAAMARRGGFPDLYSYEQYANAVNEEKKRLSNPPAEPVKPEFSQEDVLAELRKWICSQNAFRKLAIKLREEAASCPNKDFHKFGGDVMSTTNFIKHEYDVGLDGAKKDYPDINSAKFNK